MKNIIIMQTLLTLTASFASHAMEPSPERQMKNEQKQACYFQKVTEIDQQFDQERKVTQVEIDKLAQKQKIKPTVQLTLPYLSTVQFELPCIPNIINQAKNQIKLNTLSVNNQRKLKRIEQNIRKEEQAIIRALLQENNMNDHQINQTFKIIQMAREFRKKFLSQTTQKNSFHDPELIEQTNIIEKQLAPQGFNSNNVNIQKAALENVQAQNEQITSFSYNYLFDQSRTLTKATISPECDTITFDPLYLNDYKHKEATGIHETEHSIQSHFTICNTLTTFIKHFINNNDYNIHSSPNYYRLRQMYEHQAEIFPSLRSAESAIIMRDQRRDGYYPDMLYDEHYHQLSNIDETHKTLAYLEKHIRKSPHSKLLPEIKQPKLLQQSQLHQYSQKPTTLQVCQNVARE